MGRWAPCPCFYCFLQERYTMPKNKKTPKPPPFDFWKKLKNTRWGGAFSTPWADDPFAYRTPKKSAPIGIELEYDSEDCDTWYECDGTCCGEDCDGDCGGDCCNGACRDNSSESSFIFAKKLFEKMPFAARRDGSLRDSGVEIVSPPLSWPEAYAFVKEATVLAKNLQEMGEVSLSTHDETGFHVHVARNVLPYPQRTLAVSRAFRHKIKHVMEVFDIDRNWESFCSPTCNFASNRDAYGFSPLIHQGTGHYAMVSWSSHHETLEFRFPGNTLDWKMQLAQLDLVQMLCDISAELPIIEWIHHVRCRTREERLATPLSKRFDRYLEENAKRYKYLSGMYLPSVL